MSMLDMVLLLVSPKQALIILILRLQFTYTYDSPGNMAAFDMSDPKAVVSPGGVGFDINCGVRLLRTNLSEKDVLPLKEQLAQSLFDHIPVGVGSKGVIPMAAQ